MKNNKYHLNANLSGIYELNFFFVAQLDDNFEKNFTILWIIICQRVKNRLFVCFNRSK